MSPFHLCNYWHEGREGGGGGGRGVCLKHSHMPITGCLWSPLKLAPSTGSPRNRDMIYYHLDSLPRVEQFTCVATALRELSKRWIRTVLQRISRNPSWSRWSVWFTPHTCRSLVRGGKKVVFCFEGIGDWERWRGSGLSLIYLQSGVVWRNAEIRPWLEVRSSPRCTPTAFLQL